MNNPFGDNSLLERFVWKKKDNLLEAASAYKKPTKSSVITATDAKIREVQMVKRRREEREEENMLLEEQRGLREREKDQVEYEDWADKEEEFHRKQAKIRVDLRIKGGREKPIDLIVKGLRMIEGEKFDDYTVCSQTPHALIASMGLDDLKDFGTDLEMMGDLAEE